MTTKYYVMPKDAAGQRTVVNGKTGTPTNLDGVTVIELPTNTGWLTVISKGKAYPDYKVALAVAAGQIKIDDVSAEGK